ncbi:MAG: hypothetical protein KME56_13245 [Candidatus Thiodiazotropha sp. (ex Ctena orbiculata)]|nr:hypothetical protein [Candidatus Thiodiazotropha taylori]PVV25768.1 MAG: hypothetical protein B6D74_02625 [gamma proteobacterium symbiont of Ctena orbiculata]MBT2997570.1 hypothetical protein [Candidatus Thiodiazotropha taylori]MBT2999004.1 hypothetical protein [Candidatus Thiodiazotropha taylori]MBT3026229.1 hypothetical protein [Candidatus Thiodiazotropha taylori]
MRIDAVLWLVFCSCLVGLGERLAAEPYGGYQPHNQTQNRPVYREEHYRWRPLNEEEQRGESSTKLVPEVFENRQSGRAQSVVDYAETPPGLPRGVYRPVEERHNITPHKDGFRFRTLSPSEQQRIKRRNDAYSKAWQPNRRETGQRLSSELYGGFEANRQQEYQFRPDKRLQKQQGRSWGYPGTFTSDPAFTEAYPAPMFRPD